MNRGVITIVLILWLLVSAGGQAEARTLEEKLDQAFGPHERHSVLRQECLRTARKITGHRRVIRHLYRHVPDAATPRVKALCQEMNDLYEANPGSKTDAQKASLARQCSTIIRERLESGKLKTIEHLKDMRRICQELTGNDVAVPF